MTLSCFTPLSWSYIPTYSRSAQSTSLQLKSIKIDSTSRFIPFGMHACQSREELANQLVPELHRIPTIVRGIPESLRELILLSSYVAIPFGSEAILDVSSYAPSDSVRQIAQRGLRKGTIGGGQGEAYPSALPLMKDLQREAPLRGLFRRFPTKSQYFFSFTESKDSALSAWISLTRRGQYHMHLEQLQRSDRASTGAMEALLLRAIHFAQESGFQTLSLGEVPCVLPKEYDGSNPSISGRFLRLINQCGKWILQPGYSAGGLFNFKDKFSPRWEPIYWLIPKERGYAIFVETLAATGVVRLIVKGRTKRL